MKRHAAETLTLRNSLMTDHGVRQQENAMNLPNNRKLWTGVAFAAVTLALGAAYAQQPPRGKSSYAPRGGCWA